MNTRKKLIGTDFSNYFTEPEQARAGYLQVFEKGFVTDYPLTIRHEDERLTEVLYNASEYKDTAGKVLGVCAAARDITAQKQASQYARSLIEASLDPLVTISPDGKITDVPCILFIRKNVSGNSPQVESNRFRSPNTKNKVRPTRSNCGASASPGADQLSPHDVVRIGSLRSVL